VWPSAGRSRLLHRNANPKSLLSRSPPQLVAMHRIGISSKSAGLAISVVIPTQNRAESLAITLECLASADRRGLEVEIVVVNNAGQDNTEEIVKSFHRRIPIRYFYEPTLGTFGKTHALNRALGAGNLGEIIAVLDDDMSPHPDWFRGVAAICSRWPEKDIFTGYTYIIWPSEQVPRWAKEQKLQSWLFSAGHIPESDAALKTGRWFLGGHFWFRSRVLEVQPRFKDVWVTEPDFQLDLVAAGFSGVSARDAKAGHRIQPTLLRKDVVEKRAIKTGRCAAWLRLQPYRKHMKQARLLHTHPLMGRLFCISNHVRWRGIYLFSYLRSSNGAGFALRLTALERMSTYLELFRAANRLEAYSLSKRVRKMVESQPNPGTQTLFSN
jgi:glycosyltransferase involved in cell wall biosynthesis